MGTPHFNLLRKVMQQISKVRAKKMLRCETVKTIPRLSYPPQKVLAVSKTHSSTLPMLHESRMLAISHCCKALAIWRLETLAVAPYSTNIAIQTKIHYFTWSPTQLISTWWTSRWTSLSKSRSQGFECHTRPLLKSPQMAISTWLVVTGWSKMSRCRCESAFCWTRIYRRRRKTSCKVRGLRYH